MAVYFGLFLQILIALDGSILKNLLDLELNLHTWEVVEYYRSCLFQTSKWHCCHERGSLVHDCIIDQLWVEVLDFDRAWDTGIFPFQNVFEGFEKQLWQEYRIDCSRVFIIFESPSALCDIVSYGDISCLCLANFETKHEDPSEADYHHELPFIELHLPDLVLLNLETGLLLSLLGARINRASLLKLELNWDVVHVRAVAHTIAGVLKIAYRLEWTETVVDFIEIDHVDECDLFEVWELKFQGPLEFVGEVIIQRANLWDQNHS